MDISFTPWLWLNWIAVAFFVGVGWTLGVLVVNAVLGLLRRGQA